MTPDERYIYSERLAILGVIGREPTADEEAIAQEDVRRFRDELEQNDQKTLKL